MIDRCADPAGTTATARDMIAAVDCFITSSVQDGYAAMVGPGSTFSQIITILLTLYVAFIGYRLIFARGSLNMGELAMRVVLIGAVLALTSNWATYQTLVFNVLTDGPEEIVAAVNPGSGGDAVAGRVDVISNALVSIANAWTLSNAKARAKDVKPEAAPPPPVSLGPIGATSRSAFGPGTLLWSALLLVVGSTGVLIVAKVLLGLILILGPLFALATLFSATRGLALGWLRAAVLLALVPLLALLTTAGGLALIEPLVARMVTDASIDRFQMSAALTILAATLALMAVSLALFWMCALMVSAWTLPRGASAGRSGSASPDAALIAAPVASGFNERTHMMVAALERSSGTASDASAPVRRDIALSMQVSQPGGGALADENGAGVRQLAMTRGRPGGSAMVAAPLRPVRNSA